MNEWLGIAVGVLLTLGTGIFVASEFALVNLDRGDLEARAARGEKRLGPTINALKITSTHLSSAQLGITLTTLLTGYTFEPAASSLLRGPLEGLGLGETAVRGVGAVVGLLLATLFSMVLGELVPKNFALAVPRQTAKVVVPLQAAFTAVFKPMVLLLNNTANAVIRGFGIEPKEELSGARSAEELTYVIRHSALAGLLEQDDATLLDRTLRFSSHDASDVMTPRTRMAYVHAGDSAAEVLEASARSGHSRLPVVEEGPDDVVGVVHVKSAFGVPPRERAAVRADALMVAPTRVPESIGADALLSVLREEGLQIAVVTDEYGGTDGVVTLEDLVEEIVGELEDEHDRAMPGVTRNGTSVSFDASWRPDEVLDRVGVVIPEDEHWDTAAGFVAHELGRLPDPGDQVPVEGGVLTVERTDGSRLVRLRFEPTEPPDGAEDEIGAVADEREARRG